jgi:hypothetical protein
MNNYSLKNNKITIVFGILIVLMLPQVAQANMLTPVMIGHWVYLEFGNTLIGIIEGLLIHFIFRTRTLRSILIMIAANYASAFLGIFTLSYFDNISVFEADKIYHYHFPLFINIFTFFAATTLIEWLFCFWIFSRSQKRWKRSLFASIVCNTVTYALLVLIFFRIGSYGSSQIQIDKSLSWVPQNNAAIYFIHPTDGNIYQIQVDGSNCRKVLETKITDSEARLFVRKNESGQFWDLWVVGYEHIPDSDKDGQKTLIKDFTSHPVSMWLIIDPEKDDEIQHNEYKKLFNRYGEEIERRIIWSESGFKEPITFLNCGPAADLRPENQRDWTVGTCGYMNSHAFLAENQKTGENIRIAYDIPLIGRGKFRNATVLPGDLVIMQLNSEIMVLDLNQRKMAPLTPGRGPVVVLPDK